MLTDPSSLPMGADWSLSDKLAWLEEITELAADLGAISERPPLLWDEPGGTRSNVRDAEHIDDRIPQDG